MKKLLLVFVSIALFFNYGCLNKKPDNQTSPQPSIEQNQGLESEQSPNQNTENEESNTDSQENVADSLPSEQEENLQPETPISEQTGLTGESKEAVDEIEKELDQLFKELQEE